MGARPRGKSRASSSISHEHMGARVIQIYLFTTGLAGMHVAMQKPERKIINRYVSPMQITGAMRTTATAKRSSGPSRNRTDFDTARTLNRFHVRVGTHTRRRRHVATDDTVHPHYVHHIYPVVLREHHRTVYRHTIQPIHMEDDVWEEGTVEERVRAPIYREVHHDMVKGDAARLSDARLRLSEVGGRRAGKPTEEEIWEEEERAAEAETEHEHLVEDVQPVVRRRIRRKHVHETVPVIEAHHHTKQVEAPTEADTISYNEWLKRAANSQGGDDDRLPSSEECSVDAGGSDKPQT